MGLPPPRKRTPPARSGTGDTGPASAHPDPDGEDATPLQAPTTETEKNASIGPGAKGTHDGWRPREHHFGGPRKDPDETRLQKERAQEAKRQRLMRRGVLKFFLVGGTAFLFGLLTAYVTFWVVGVFLASQIGIPALVGLLLLQSRRMLREGITDSELAQATGGLPIAGFFALWSFWLFFTFTTVWQLAVGLALAILAFQLYATHERLRRAGFTGFGPGLRLTLLPLGAYAGWLIAFHVAGGFVPVLFDLVSASAAYVFAIKVLKEARRTARRAPQEYQRDPAIAAGAPDARGATAKHLLVAVIVGYLFFRFFVSSHIPYGPVVEWIIVSLSALFFAIVAAARIGTVPTTKSLPPPHVRTHEQKVWSLPDQHIWELERRLGAYIRHNKEKEWVRSHFMALLVQSGVDAGKSRPLLERLDGHRTHETDRRETVLALTRLLDEADGNTIDRMKAKVSVGPTGPPKGAPSGPA